MDKSFVILAPSILSADFAGDRTLSRIRRLRPRPLPPGAGEGWDGGTVSA
jgi:hypothetical protein